MVNVDVTSRGATLALGMMYFKTGNEYVIYINKYIKCLILYKLYFIEL